MRIQVLSSFLLLSILLSCENDPEFVEPDSGLDYFPITEGTYVIYDVDSIVYNDFTRDTDRYFYQVKEEIGLALSSDNHRELLRYYRNSDSSEWVLRKRYAIFRDSREARRLEENNLITNLVFPLIPGQQWNGNKYNSLNEESFKLLSLSEKDTFNSFVIENLAHVEHYNSENLIEKRSAEEKFAKGIGLVYHFKEYIFTRTDGINTQNDVDSGLTYTIRLNQFHIPD